MSIRFNAEHADDTGPEKVLNELFFFLSTTCLHGAALPFKNLHGPAGRCVNEGWIRAGFCPFKNFSRLV